MSLEAALREEEYEKRIQWVRTGLSVAVVLGMAALIWFYRGLFHPGVFAHRTGKV